MPIEWEVKHGECIASIAYDAGIDPDTVWLHPKNAGLRERRVNPNTLVPGEDTVFIPDKQARWEDGSTDRRHRFRKHGAAEMLRLRLLDYEDRARGGLAYKLTLGEQVFSGTTADDGSLAHPCAPGSNDGVLLVHGKDGDEVYELAIGSLPPLRTVAGVWARFVNLGLLELTQVRTGPSSQDSLEAAVRLFQKEEGLPTTGEMTEPDYQALRRRHGS